MAIIEYLTKAGVADRLGLSESTIQGYDLKGRLPVPNATLGRVRGWLPHTVDEWNGRRPGVRPDADHEDWYVLIHNTIAFLSVPMFAERIGVVRGAMNRYKLPPADAKFGEQLGWLPQTVEEWDARRPRVRTASGDEYWYLQPELQEQLQRLG